MTPKEKAKELFDKMSNQTYSFQEYAGAHLSTEIVGWEAGVKCAMVAVDEIQNILSMPNMPKYYPIATDEYWQEVRAELEKL